MPGRISLPDVQTRRERNEDHVSEDDVHNPLQCSNRELHTMILRKFQQLTQHVDLCMLKQEDLIKSLSQPKYHSLSPSWAIPPTTRPKVGTASSDAVSFVASDKSEGVPPNAGKAQPGTPFTNLEAAKKVRVSETSQQQIDRNVRMKTGKQKKGQSSSMLRVGTGQSSLGGAVLGKTGTCSTGTGGSSLRATSQFEFEMTGGDSFLSHLTTVTKYDTAMRERSEIVAAAKRFKSRVTTKEALKSNSWAARVTAHRAFEPFFAGAVLVNSIFIGIEVDVMSRRGNEGPPALFYAITHLFAAIFFVELLLRILAQRITFFTDPSFWNILDCGLVCCSFVDVGLDITSLVTKENAVTGASNANSVRVLRLIRITRIIRVIRLVRVVRFIRALRTLVYSIATTMKSLVWAILLLLMITYIFGIIFTQAATNHLENNDNPDDAVVLYWSSLSKSIFTLFKTVSGGISWADVVNPLANVHWITVMLFVGFITFMQFAMINVLTGVFCQSAIDSASHDYDLVIQNHLTNKEMYMAKVEEVFKSIDKTGEGQVSVAEFEAYLEDPKVSAYLECLELDTSDVWALFKLLDLDRSHLLDIGEFLLGCLRLKGPAKAIEIAKLSYDARVHRKRVNEFMYRVEKVMGIDVPRTTYYAVHPTASEDNGEQHRQSTRMSQAVPQSNNTVVSFRESSSQERNPEKVDEINLERPWTEDGAITLDGAQDANLLCLQTEAPCPVGKQFSADAEAESMPLDLSRGVQSYG